MKQFIFLVETNKIGCHVIYVNPSNQQFDNCFKEKSDDPEDVYIFAKEKLQSLLSSTEYFGSINTKNLVGTVDTDPLQGFSASFISDFFAPTKTTQFHEIIIDDLYFLTQSITFKDKINSEKVQVTAFNLVLVLKRTDPEYVAYCKRSLIYLAKVLELDEQMRSYLSCQVKEINDKSAEFEKKLHMIPGELEKIKANKQEVLQRLSEIKSQAQAVTKTVEIYQIFKYFCGSLESFQEIKINHFLQKLAKPDMILNPIKIDIKPFQTIILYKRDQCFNTAPNVKSLRFEKFITISNPNSSFQELSIQFNFSLTEIQTYVTHLLIHKKGIIINKFSHDTLFTLNTKYEFYMDKSTKKLSESFFVKYGLDLINVLSAFNKPSRCSQVSEKIAGFDGNCLITMLILQILQECDVYLYMKDPFLTTDQIRLALKQRLNDSQQKSPAIASPKEDPQVIQQDTMSKEDKMDMAIMREVLTKYVGQKVSLNEIAWILGAEMSKMWRFLKKYEDYIGYFYIL